MVFLSLGTIASYHNGTQFEGGNWVSNRIRSGPEEDPWGGSRGRTSSAP